MNRPRYRPRERPGLIIVLLERLTGAMAGAAAGALLFVAVNPSRTTLSMGPALWSLPGPILWFMAAGAALGALFGLSLVKRLWSIAKDLIRYEDEQENHGAIGKVIVAIVVVVVVVLIVSGT